MLRKIASALLAFLLLALLEIPVNPWVYQDNGSCDATFEKFGPRAARLLIKLYANETAELDALARGDIDVTDSDLSKPYYDSFVTNAINPSTGLPYNETINAVSYGAQFKIYLLDVNNNNNEFLGNPPDPAYPNPVYPNPCSVKEFRQAIAYLTDRSQLDTIIGKGCYAPLYTPVPSSMGGYAHPEIRAGGALENLTYAYSRKAAEALLDANGFPVNASTGWRYWDRNHNNIEDQGEYLELKFLIRHDDAHRLAFGNFMADELESVKVKVNRIYNIVSTFPEFWEKKDFHLHTGAWSLGVEPDHLILWNWDYYWHPGRPYNYAGVNNQDFNTYSYLVLYADTIGQAKTNAWRAQEVFASEALSVPLWSNVGSKAMCRIYTGGNKWASVTPDDGENMYRGKYWDGAVNRLAYGIDDFHSFLNMHPRGHERGDGENMAIRWGFSVPEIRTLNPIYAERRWDWNVLKQVYESLLMRNPYDSGEFTPWLAEHFEEGTYNHPEFGECTKVRFTMRAEATWQDGTPITTADAYFTWVELWQILEKRVPWPYWNSWHGRTSWRQPMVDFKILDPYNFEMLFDFRNCMRALSWISNEVILPKHIWKPIAETGPSDVLTGPAPDPNMIGCGPWRLKEYAASSHVLLVANKPGCTVQTSFAGSTPVTSTRGYWGYVPLDIEWQIDESTSSKVSYGESHTVSVTISNLYYSSPLAIDVYSKMTCPNGTVVELTQADIVLNATEQSGSSWTWTYTSLMKCKIRFDLNLFVKSPPTMVRWLNTTKYAWATIPSMPADITGSYHVDPQLPAPDFQVDIKDIAESAKSFGAYPGHVKWSPIGDINNDYKIDIRDIALLAKKFGWTGTP